MTRPAQVVFGLLLVACFGAFFVSQRLKQSPRVVRALTITSEFSPNGDNRRERASIRFQVKESDDVAVRIIDANGDAVRTLLDDRRVAAGKRVQLFWDGRADDNATVPDGAYRVRVTLRDAGRSAVFAQEIRVDTTPPKPLVFVTSPGGGGPAVVQPGDPVTFRFTGPLRLPARVFVFKTDEGGSKLVTQFRGRPGARVLQWSGRIGGLPAPPGLYVIAVKLRDRVSNAAYSPILRPAAPGDPRGRPGVTVRRLGVTAPVEPTRAGQRAVFQIQSFDRPYRWQIRRIGFAQPLRRPGTRGTGRGPLLQVAPPAGARSGMYLLDVTVPARRVPAAPGAGPAALQPAYRQTVPFPVQARARQKVLVVLPAIAWQGRNPQDDTGDGLPNTLTRGGPAGLERPYSPVGANGRGLPIGFPSQEAPLLDFLDRAGFRYDITTDVALERRTGPRLEGHTGVVLAGNPRWTAPSVGQRLLDWVRRGGRVFTLGTASLLRTAEVDAQQLVKPSGRADRDVFGARLGAVVPGDQPVLAYEDELGLFVGGDGQFTGFPRREPTDGWAGGRVVSAAGVEEGRPVIAGARVGKGLVIRPGLARFADAIATNPNAEAMTRRAWTLLQG